MGEENAAAASPYITLLLALQYYKSITVIEYIHILLYTS